MAATRAFGLAGMLEGLAPCNGKDARWVLPRSLPDALDALANPRQDWDLKHLIELA